MLITLCKHIYLSILHIYIYIYIYIYIKYIYTYTCIYIYIYIYIYVYIYLCICHNKRKPVEKILLKIQASHMILRGQKNN